MIRRHSGRVVRYAWIAGTLLIAGCGAAPPAEPRTTGTYDSAVALAAIQQGHYDTAIALETKALDSGGLPPKLRAAALNDRGIAYVQVGSLKEALADFDESLRLDPGLFPALVNRGHAHLELGETQKALDDYDAAVALKPGVGEGQLGRAQVFMRLGEYAKALPDLDATITLKPYLEEAYSLRGRTRLGLGKGSEAFEDYSRAIALAPQSPAPYRARAEGFLIQGDFVRAIEDASTAIRVEPSQAGNFRLRGQAEFIAGQFAPAANDLARSIALDPKDADAAIWLHLAQRRAGIADPDDYARLAGGIDLASWPGPIVAFTLGASSEANLVQAAAAGQPDRECQTAFYLGEAALIKHKPGDSVPLLQKATRSCPGRDLERTGAAAELARLGH